MRIEFVEIANFRRLRSTRVGLSEENTVFVGANNSGKTSAMVALRFFLLERERRNISLNDFTLSHWPSINLVGDSWEQSMAADEPLPAPNLDEFLPFLDIWLQVKDDEVHYVQKILPTLDWEGGRIGVRLRFEPKDAEELQKAFLAARSDVQNLQKIGSEEPSEGATDGAAEAADALSVSLWPQDLIDFLRRRLQTFFNVRAYVLDPDKCENPKYGRAQPQTLPEDSDPIDGDPFRGLIQIDEISAQRGFGEAENAREDDAKTLGAVPGTRKLSEQLRQYYNKHLDPTENPDAQDLKALKAIEDAQKAFDGRLKDGFSPALKELEKLGYPGVSDPMLNISTRLRPVDGLKHEAAVQYVMQMTQGGSTLWLAPS